MNQLNQFAQSGPEQEYASGSVFSEVQEIERIDRKLGEAVSRVSAMLGTLLTPPVPENGAGTKGAIAPADPIRSELAGRIAHVRQSIDSKIDALHATLNLVRLS